MFQIFINLSIKFTLWVTLAFSGKGHISQRALPRRHSQGFVTRPWTHDFGQKVTFFFIVWFCAKSARNIKCLLIFEMKNKTCYTIETQFYIVAKMGIFPKARGVTHDFGQESSSFFSQLAGADYFGSCSLSVLARIDQEKMFTDVLNKKEDNIAHDDDGDDDENRLYPRFSSILSIGSSLIGASIEIA